MFLYKNINIDSYPDGTFKPNEAVTRGGGAGNAPESVKYTVA
ncbi:S-layer homology domain-containing protein [Sporosarcina sp. P7]|nr:S-layer homology domain-containing protein [Sporosarcina sp. P7]